jgi:hypothetical protein
MLGPYISVARLPAHSPIAVARNIRENRSVTVGERYRCSDLTSTLTMYSDCIFIYRGSHTQFMVPLLNATLVEILRNRNPNDTVA